jgi:hypothetical protein
MNYSTEMATLGAGFDSDDLQGAEFSATLAG